MAKSATSRQIVIPEARLAWPKIFTPEERRYPNDPPGKEPALVYSAELIIPLTHPVLQELGQEFVNVANQQWREHGASVLSMLKQEKRIAVHTDAKLDQNGVPREEYVGMARLTASNKYRPAIFNLDGTELHTDDGTIYGGCYVSAIVSLWAQDNPKGGRRINANLLGVRFLRDGDAFGGGAASKITADAFGPVAVSGNPFAAPAPAAAPVPAAAASFF